MANFGFLLNTIANAIDRLQSLIGRLGVLVSNAWAKEQYSVYSID
jgi:hypothetical protein